MLYADVEENTPAIVVPDVGAAPFSAYVGKNDTEYSIERAGIILLPFLDKSVFRGTDVGLQARMEMQRHLIRTGLFTKVLVGVGTPGWFRISFTLAYNKKSYEGWLYYPNPYKGGGA